MTLQNGAANSRGWVCLPSRCDLASPRRVAVQVKRVAVTHQLRERVEEGSCRPAGVCSQWKVCPAAVGAGADSVVQLNIAEFSRAYRIQQSIPNSAGGEAGSLGGEAEWAHQCS